MSVGENRSGSFLIRFLSDSYHTARLSRSDNFFYEGEFDDQDVGDYDKGEYDKILDDDDDEDSSVSSMNSASSVRQSFGSSNAR